MAYNALGCYGKAIKSAQLGVNLDACAWGWDVIVDSYSGLKNAQMTIWASVNGLKCNDAEYNSSFQSAIDGILISHEGGGDEVTALETKLEQLQQTHKERVQQLTEIELRHEKARKLWEQEMQKLEMRYHLELDGIRQKCAGLQVTIDIQREMIEAVNRERDDLVELASTLEKQVEARDRELLSCRVESKDQSHSPYPSSTTSRGDSPRSHRSTQAWSVSPDKSPAMPLQVPEAVKENFNFIIDPLDPAQATSPQAAVLYANQAASNFNSENFTLALQHAGKCVQLDPTYARGWYIKGLCHYTLKEPEEAYEALEAEAKIYSETIERIRHQQHQLYSTRPFSISHIITVFLLPILNLYISWRNVVFEAMGIALSQDD
eukprot:Protomagalhaensia_sp_Gyna_25__4790@NODE_484_length_3296_cov_44_830519_g376_i0_p2_GENE_NODE_484_length_3296_cov_44_830519_g376_i0NODE_484_length_3296_cov_44_830519_g376_i0_p2_ORF_typecomplete_len377_score39_79TPR_9/PF13371_6/1_2e03TPR_9/PF13371_6/2_2e06TPR_16/PF13432_6/1_2e03TPR_16/PF13432_6/3_7e07ANAPC3/PF12895_7/6_8e07ChAPs/PF09295_10/1_6e03ChAPs/PF09295_10/7_3e06TPR_19/PF14559_6/0_00046Golgin_A5/PF09787_9/0_00035Golgin_A5/PF09787_9/1_7e03TPR_2/PF07719_17/8_8e02TPR_2/PF07719_17/3_8e03TPR_2/PF07